MKSEEKAKELIKFFREYCTTTKNINQDQSIYTEFDYAKKCAIKCAEEVLLEWKNENNRIAKISYWNDVINYIEKL